VKIVVLDGYTLNPGDLSWDALEALGRCAFYDRTPADEVVGRARGADVVLTNKVPLGRDAIAELPDLTYIGVLATGYNIVDVEVAAEHGIPVTNVPEYGTRSVAQMTFALLLELAQHVGHHARTVRDGRWCASEDFCYWDHPLVELAGLTMGIVGFGRIGRAVAELARAFGMGVLANDIAVPKDAAGVEFVDLDALFSRSDVVSLHCPLTPDNEGLVNAERLNQMKESAFLINTSRGQLVNERDLAEALNSGRVAGAGLDVLAVEPPSAGNPLLAARNCIITPHVAWATRAARQRLLSAVVENVRAFLEGTPRNVVNAPLP
jgi:glycerate dehydrogenase